MRKIKGPDKLIIIKTDTSWDIKIIKNEDLEQEKEFEFESLIGV